VDITVTHAEEFLENIVSCTTDYTDRDDIQKCVEGLFEKFEGKKNGKKSGKKRKASNWNLGVKDCFSRNIGMKECSTWWKGLSKDEQERVVSKYK